MAQKTPAVQQGGSDRARRRRRPPPHRPRSGDATGAGKPAARRRAVAADEPERRRPGRPKVTELPDPETGLTRRQQAILDVIRDSVERRGYPPSIREICESAGLASTSSVAHQLAMLERKGFLRRDPNRPRAVDVRLGSDGERPKAARRAVAVTDDAPRGDAPVFVPVVGPHRRGRPDPRRADDRGRLPAAQDARRRRARCSCSRWSATR